MSIQTDLVVSRVNSPQDLIGLQPEWDRLDATIATRTPFTSFHWNFLWWKHFGRSEFWVRHTFFVHTVRDLEGRLRAVVPWFITDYPLAGPFRMRLLRNFGSDNSLTEVRSVICKEDDEPDILSALQAYLETIPEHWDAVEWNGIRTLDARDRLEARSQLSLSQMTPMYVLPLPSTWDALNRSLGSSTRKYFRKIYETIENFHERVEFRVLRDVDAIERALPLFFKLHALRANAAEMFSHPNKFHRSRNRQFVSEICLELARSGEMGLIELAIDSRIVANRLCFFIGDALYVYYSGYDPEYRDYSVGTVLMVELAKWAIDNKISLLNLSAGRDLSKLRWRPQELRFETGVQLKPGAQGRRVSHLYEWLQDFRRLRRRAFGL